MLPSSTTHVWPARSVATYAACARTLTTKIITSAIWNTRFRVASTWKNAVPTLYIINVSCGRQTLPRFRSVTKDGAVAQLKA